MGDISLGSIFGKKIKAMGLVPPPPPPTPPPLPPAPTTDTTEAGEQSRRQTTSTTDRASTFLTGDLVPKPKKKTVLG